VIVFFPIDGKLASQKAKQEQPILLCSLATSMTVEMHKATMQKKVYT